MVTYHKKSHNNANEMFKIFLKKPTKYRIDRQAIIQYNLTVIRYWYQKVLLDRVKHDQIHASYRTL